MDATEFFVSVVTTGVIASCFFPVLRGRWLPVPVASSLPSTLSFPLDSDSLLELQQNGIS